MTAAAEPAAFAALASAGIAAFAAVLFARAALHKAWDFTEFTGFVQDYRLVPDGAVPLVGALLLAAEAAVVLALMAPGLRSPALIAAAALLAGYGLAMGINIARGRRHVECGCGGAVQVLGPALLLRNGVLAGLMLLGAALPGQPLSVAETLAALAAGLIVFAGYVMADQLLSNAAYLVRREQGKMQ